MDKLQVFSEKLNSPITIGAILGEKDINNISYYDSWTNGGWSNSGSTWINDGWSNSGSTWINDGWSNSGSTWINDGWSNSGSTWINSGWSNGAGGGRWYNDSGSGGGWYNDSGSGGGWYNEGGGSGGGGKGHGPGNIISLLKIVAIVFLILMGAGLVTMAVNGDLDIKFLRGSDYIGEWSYDSLYYTSDGIIYRADGDFDFLCNFAINKDGTFSIELNGEDAYGTWTKAEIDSLTALILTYDEGTSNEIESLIQDDVIYYVRVNNMAELYNHKGDMFFYLNGYDPEEAVYMVFIKE